ncbi:PREDICTED: uncharacterized protein LOC109353899 [Lupinus angustifolius]|uniref:uncharacterized protein LOC109353899 n=1 Tax=Lupinus angustifolius TaxID=3871 RepID=UPI00092F75D0|nr:PREDICTED: uncharacterized protein LOC109353899 [Lupinus angustifolius]
MHVSSIQVIQNAVVRENVLDSWEWRHDKSKLYSVKSAYDLLFRHHHQPPSSDINHICMLWKSKAPLKVKAFVWRLFQDRIPTVDALLKRGVSIAPGAGTLCPFCNDQAETSQHLFSSCNFTYSVWQLLYNWLNIHIALPLQPIHHFTNHMGMVPHRRCLNYWNILWLATIWAIWRSRNDFIFNSVHPSVEKIFEAARVTSWLLINGKRASFSPMTKD